MTTQISLSDEQLERVREELSSKGLASAVALIRQLSSADLAGAVAYARQLQKTLGESEEPAMSPEETGVLVAISKPGHNVVYSTELFVLSGAARTELGRAPDFEDSRVVSWGRLTSDEVARLLRLESHPRPQTEITETLQELYSASPIVTLYYADPYRVY